MRYIPLLSLLLILCAPREKPPPIPIEPPPLPPLEKIVTPPLPGFSPILRVGLCELESVTFETPLPFRIYKKGKLLLRGDAGIYHLRLGVSKPAVYEYYTVVDEVKYRGEAMKLKEELESRGYRVRLERVGVYFDFGEKKLDNRRFLILVGPHSSASEAKKFEGPKKGIVSLIKKPPEGEIELLDNGGNLLLTTGGFLRILPGEDKPQRFTIFDIPIGEGFSWSKEKTLNYTGILEFRVSNRGKILVINELPVEEYLKGVLPSEMSSDFPLEALKAQAILARSMVFSLWGRKYKFIGEPYDFSDDVYFQVFTGITYRTDKTDRAVMDTRGEVLFYGDEVAETPYHSICGGHTESSDLLWGRKKPYLEGVPDLPHSSSFDYNLKNERDVREWLLSFPPAYCNPSNSIPPSAKHAKSSFRWRITYSRRELERIIRRKTGKNVGTLLGLTPIRRGRSGRILELLIEGTRRSFRVKGELEIRNSLSPNHLKSSLFIIDEIRGRGGIPEKFIIIGGGFGHGVGMCQIGAAVRAERGESFKEILEAYFPGTELRRIY
jgi:SpoIID/LytB domain protein